MKTRKIILMGLLFLLLTACKGNSSCSIPNNQNVVWAISPQYILGRNFSDGVASVMQKQGAHFIDKAGNPQFDLYVDSIPVRFSNNFPGFRNGVAIIERDGQRNYLLRNGRESSKVYSDSYWNLFLPYSQSLCPVEQNGKYGLVNCQDLWYVEPAFDLFSLNSDGSISLFDEENNFCVVAQANGSLDSIQSIKIKSVSEGKYFSLEKGQYIDLSTGAVINDSVKYDDGYEFSEGFAVVNKNGKYGYINEYGEEVIPLIYQFAHDFHSGYAIARNFNDDYFSIDRNGSAQKIIYEIADYNCHSGLFIVKNGKKYGIIDNLGNQILCPQYTYIDWNEYGCFNLISGTQKGLFVPETSILIDAVYDKVCFLSNHRCLVEKDGLINIIDLDTGKTLLENYLYWNRAFGEGLIAVCESKNGPIGYIDYDGKWVIAPQFEDASGFREGLAAVCVNGYIGYIANPLIYSIWEENENARAKLLGLEFQTPAEAVEWIFKELNIDMPNSLEKNMLEHYNKTVITRLDLAKIVTETASTMGENTNCFLSEFNDIIPETDTYSAISYSTSIGVVQTVGNFFYPDKEVSKSEAERAFLRLYEYMLDFYTRQHPKSAF